MVGRVNGKADRLGDLQGDRGGRGRPRQSAVTTAQALAMIDRAIATYGVDPATITDPQGWRRLEQGSAVCLAGVVEWPTKEPYLVVFSPVLELPTKTTQLGAFYRLLLELNHEATLSAHFSVHGDTLFLAVTRPLRALDEEEVREALLSVLTLADLHDDPLQVSATGVEVPRTPE
jgi:hypothetical protein